MYHLLPMPKIIAVAVFLNAVVIAYLAYFLNPLATSASLETLKYLSAAMSVLDIIILLVSTYLWRWLWKVFPFLSDKYFPDINGIWEGKIIFHDIAENNGLVAKARIRQDLWSIHIDLFSTTSKSHTLVAYPTIEAGNQILYYVYHNTPQNPEYPEYKGTSLLLIKGKTTALELSGHYFTVRGTKGRIELKRVNDDPKENIEMG
jgi:hypothetical protein